MSTPALLVIDVQTALCEGPMRVHEAEAIIDRINLLARRARREGAPVVFVQHDGVTGELAAGSAGWQFAAGLEVLPGDRVQAKAQSDAFNHTELASLLQQQGIDHLIVCGMQSDYCVDSTVRRALALGFSVTLVEDAHTTVDSAVLSAPQIIAHHTATLCGISSYGVRARPVAAAQVDFGRA